MPAFAPNALLNKLKIKLPIIQGPMNNAATPALAAAVSNAGGLGSLALSLCSPETIARQVALLRQQTDRPFNLNLFVLAPAQATATELQNANNILAPIRQELGLSQAPALTQYAENFTEQLEALIQARPAVASFTFGILSEAEIERVHAAGSLVLGTATNVAEALAWQARGADMICAQGAEAGGHRGTFIGSFEASMVGTMALVPQIVDAVRLPVIAAGGVMDGRGIAASLMLGAQAAQLGTAFLVCRESAIHPGWKNIVRGAADTATRTTRVFSGRPARGVVNAMMQRLAAYEAEVPDYPVQNALTTAIRQAATSADKMEYLSLWAGQAAGLSAKRASDISAAELVRQLAAELQRVSQTAG